MPAENSRNGHETTFVPGSEPSASLSPPQGGEKRGGDATPTRASRVARGDSEFTENLSSSPALARDATRDASLEEPCNIDYRSGPGHYGWCWAWHDTPDHRDRLNRFLREEWQVIDAHDLWDEYPAEVILAAAWEFRKRKPETAKSPSGFFVSRLRKLVERYREGGDMHDWARNYM